jgi:Polyketide cyclase / dehydrase and lipid transport
MRKLRVPGNDWTFLDGRENAMFIKIIIALGIVVVLFLFIAAIQPSDFRISRTTTIDAPADVVFAQVNDFHRMNLWSPWLEPDPEAKQSYGGAPSGTGAIFAWSGNSRVGEGRLRITESHPNDLVRINMDFIKPMKNTCTAEFTLKPVGDQTQITWAMFGKRPFVGKAIGLFINMDKMIGGNFEKGLAKMKIITESTAGIGFSDSM